MDPVDPSRDRRFLKVDPFRDSWRVRRADASELTGADGLSNQPSPVPLLPEIALREVLVFPTAAFNVKAVVDAVAVSTVTSAPKESFIFFIFGM